MGKKLDWVLDGVTIASLVLIIEGTPLYLGYKLVEKFCSPEAKQSKTIYQTRNIDKLKYSQFVSTNPYDRKSYQGERDEKIYGLSRIDTNAAMKKDTAYE